MEELPGIPGTTSEAVRRLRWIRRGDFDNCRTYEARTPDGTLKALVAREAVPDSKRPLWHLSVSHSDQDGRPDRMPSWDEIKHAKYTLVQEDVCMVLIFPRKKVPYADAHPTTLHLWEETREIDL